jgi:pterin-4a-carbinolamine dehydratase
MLVLQHHPDLHLTGYRNVEVVLYTHSVGGVTENDLIMAGLIDEVKVAYSPKWLKEHPEAAHTVKS